MILLSNTIFDEPILESLRAEMPMLHRQNLYFAEHQPLKGLSIFHTVPLALNTLIKIEGLLLAGAEVTVGCTRVVNPSAAAIKILDKYGIELNFDKPKRVYDLHLDCAAELSEFQPRLGAVELTRSGSQIYQQMSLNYPVISVDDSKIKHLETIGTGLSVLQAFRKMVSESLIGQKIILFGCGKVGTGVLYAFLKNKIDVTVVEQDPKILAKLKSLNIATCDISDVDQIRDQVCQAFALFTATGVPGLIGQHFLPKELKSLYCVNLGAVDEFGPTFPKEMILFGKQPINFCLENPTHNRYIDPSLYTHNHSAEILLHSLRNPGYHKYPSAEANILLKQWAKINSFEFDKIGLELYDGLFN